MEDGGECVASLKSEADGGCTNSVVFTETGLIGEPDFDVEKHNLAQPISRALLIPMVRRFSYMCH